MVIVYVTVCALFTSYVTCILISSTTTTTTPAKDCEDDDEREYQRANDHRTIPWPATTNVLYAPRRLRARSMSTATCGPVSSAP